MSGHQPTQYVLDPLAPFPKRWRDPLGPIRVMGGPHEGYVMVRRPGAAPFCLHVSELTNASAGRRYRGRGPYEIVERRK